MSRKADFTNGKKVVAALKNIDTASRYLDIKVNEFGYSKADAMKLLGNAVSDYKTKQLIERGFVKNEPLNNSRGCPVKPVLTGKGRGFIALSKNWK